MRPWFKGIGQYQLSKMSTIPEIQVNTDEAETVAKELDSSIKEISPKLTSINSALQVIANTKTPEPEGEGYYLREHGGWKRIDKQHYVIKTYKDSFDIYYKNINETHSTTLTQLIKDIRTGKITENDIGNELDITYRNPLDSTEVVSMPFIFCTLQQFEREDGSLFKGLGLVPKFGIPIGGAQFDYMESNFPYIESTSPAPEENTGENGGIDTNLNNEVFKRRTYGSNIWIRSNIRQWLNGTTSQWFTKYDAYDESPDKPDPRSTLGFPKYLPEEFVDAIVPVKMVTVRNKVDETHADGELPPNTYIETYDKFFLLSMSQLNIHITDTNYGINGNIEGSRWEYFKNIIDDFIAHNTEGYNLDKDEDGYIVTNGNDDTAAHNCGFPIRDNFKPADNPTGACSFWTRSAELQCCCNVLAISSTGQIVHAPANSVIYAFPACVLG